MKVGSDYRKGTKSRIRPSRRNWRLPKFVPEDCPCREPDPLVDVKPLAPLKPRFKYKEPEKICDVEAICTTPRADDNYQIKKKVLPKIELQQCPCIQTEWVDVKLKRLPKKVIKEPEKICPPCMENPICCDVVRADDSYKIEKKRLPVLQVPDCPCYEPPELTTVPLPVLKPKPVEEPLRICVDLEVCDETIRADAGMKIKPKILPKLEAPDCPCPEPPDQDNVRLPRLKKVKHVEKPRKPCVTTTCEDVVRADEKLKVKQKKLPKYVPQDCPCFEPEPPEDVHFRRLEPRPVKEPERVCLEVEPCPPRADEGLRIKPKHLPELIPGECPCVEENFDDAPPLQRLKPKPVVEPPKVCGVCTTTCCDPERADEGRKVKKKILPVIEAPDCPCYDPPELTSVSLARLKPKPVKVPARICPKEEVCDETERADTGRKIEQKHLPKLVVPDCPCKDSDELDDVPLRRLKKVKIAEPKRVCPATDDCDDALRADQDDWLYWKRVEVSKSDVGNKAKPNPNHNQSKRKYSTCCRRHQRFHKFDLKTPLSFNAKNSSSGGPSECSSDVKSLRSAATAQENFSRIFQSPRSSMDNHNMALSLLGIINRFVSTYKVQLQRISQEPYMQPKNPIVKGTEKFIIPYPDDELIEAARSKSRRQYKNAAAQGGTASKEEQAAIDDETCVDEDEDVNESCAPEQLMDCIEKPKLTLWQRIVNYFKARDCPSPEELRRMRLVEEAQKAAEKAGLCLYDPKECNSDGEKLPKVITANRAEAEVKKEC